MTQRVRMTIDAEIPDNVSQDEIAERLGKLLSSAGLEAMTSGDEYVSPHVPIKTIGPRMAGRVGTGGYETRIWEKATCRILEFAPGRLDDVIINPRVNIEVISRAEEVARDISG